MTHADEPTDLFAEYGAAAFSPRAVAATVDVELEGGLPAFGTPGQPEYRPAHPPLVARFRVPDAVTLAGLEAKAREQGGALVKAQAAGQRYGLEGEALANPDVVAHLVPLITAIETATALIVDWNYARPDGAGGFEKAPISVEVVSELFRGRPRVRQAWLIHLDNVSPMERVEGNASAASPSTTSATAANTVGDASVEGPPAPSAASGDQADAVPG